MSQGGKGESIDAPLNRVNDIIAKDAGSSSTQVQRIKYVLDNASEPIKQKLLNGRMKVNRAYKDLRNQHWLAEQIANNKKLDLAFDQATDKITLLEGDFEARCSELEADSVSLIFTDPLYDENHIYLYDGLGKVAMRLLRPGGSLITYINQIKLFVIGQKLLANGLTFWCPLYLKMAGNSSRYFDRHIEVDIKLLLWFVKGNRPINPSFPKTKNDGKRNYMGDLIISEVPDKRFHNYGQNPKDVEHIMKYLTATNDLILDPFLGGGSTAVACMNLQRRFIGIDVDPMAIERTTANLRMNTTLVS